MSTPLAIDQPADAGSTAYQWRLTALLSVSFGFVLFRPQRAEFLDALRPAGARAQQHRSGRLVGGLSLTWAIAAFGVGVVADRFGSRKKLLILSTALFALCSFGSGLATGFAFMLATRLLMGAAEGGIMPLSQSLIASQVDPRRRGIAMGIAQGLGSSLMGSFVAPVVLVAFGTRVRLASCVLPGRRTRFARCVGDGMDDPRAGADRRTAGRYSCNER